MSYNEHASYLESRWIFAYTYLVSPAVLEHPLGRIESQ